MRVRVRPAPAVLPALVILLALALRISLLGVDLRLHPDEALYAAQARTIVAQDDLLLRRTDLDKPPLTLYAMALSFRALGVSELAARLPNVLFSGLSVAALYALARSLYGASPAVPLAALLLALSPYDLTFAATAFTDVQATFWLLVAAGCAACGRWRTAGVAAGLVFACKPNALGLLPLVFALGVVRQAAADWSWRDVARHAWELLGPLALVVALTVVWDLARAPQSFLALGAARNTPDRLIRSDEVWPRLAAWIGWLRWSLGPPALGLVITGAGALRLLRGPRHERSWLADMWIAIGVLSMLSALWLIAFNTYDRYLHALVPFALLLAARALTELSEGLRLRRWLKIAGVALLVALMAPSTLTVLKGRAPLGGDQGRHAGIEALTAFMNAELAGETVYDYWLGWELAYYLGEQPGPRIVYLASPEALAAAMRQEAVMRYFVAPSRDRAAPWLAGLVREGVLTSAVYHDAAHDFVVFGLHPARP